MKRIINASVGAVFVALALAGVAAVSQDHNWFSQPVYETPGNIEAPHVKNLMNERLALRLSMFTPAWSLKLKPNSSEQMKNWLQTIDKVTVRCEYGAHNKSRKNLVRYDVEFVSGEKILNQEMKEKNTCSPQKQTLPMRLDFKGSEVVRVTSDARALTKSAQALRADIEPLVESLFDLEIKRNRDVYFNA